MTKEREALFLKTTISLKHASQESASLLIQSTSPLHQIPPSASHKSNKRRRLNHKNIPILSTALQSLYKEKKSIKEPNLTRAFLKKEKDVAFIHISF
jgi:hypothetical protein